MKIKNKTVLGLICKLGYWRNKQNLSSLKIASNGRFYIYNVGGLHIASEAFNWYLTPALLEQEVRKISCRYYTPQEGDTVVDIGAGLGEECTIYAGMVGTKGTVYAIEANPVVFNILHTVVELNKFDNVKTFNLALNHTAGRVKIDDAALSYLSSSLDNEYKGVEYKVEGLPLESFCTIHGIKVINLLKVNIEGAERFLSSAFADENLFIVNAAIACHDFRFDNEGNDFFRTKQLVTDYLQANGYETWSQQTGKKYIDDWVYGRKAGA